MLASGSNTPREGEYSAICEFCETLLKIFSAPFNSYHSTAEERSLRYRPKHYDSYLLLEKSAKTCKVCYKLMSATYSHLEETGTQPFPRDESSTYQLTHSYEPFTDPASLQREVISPVKFLIAGYLSDQYFHILIKGETGDGPIRNRAVWSDKTWIRFEDRVPVLKEWLNQCHTDHPDCNYRTWNDNQMPTRLIDLYQDNFDFNPRLVYTSSLIEFQIRYTTLSHRWGTEEDDQPIRTLKRREKSFLASIFPRSRNDKLEIPRTFRDAFRITQALGIRYIWIDSLCIVQDDEDDWRREAMRMGDVYRGSFLNVAAIDSPNCRGGCSLDFIPAASSVVMSDGSKATVRAPAAHVADVYDSHLNTRGWVFQELMLPARILYCGKKQFYWQCTAMVCSEDGYIDHNFPLNIPGVREPYRPKSPNIPYPWWSWVQDFSKRMFTKPSDRIAATAGVVKRYQEETGFTPILGLWKETLVEDLSWRVRTADSYDVLPTERSSIPNLPSWSWLAIQNDRYGGGVSHFNVWDGLMETTTRVLDVVVQWESEPMVSDVAFTKLVVEGPLERVVFEYDSYAKRFQPEGEDPKYDLSLDINDVRMDDPISDELCDGEIFEFWCLQLSYALDDEGREITTFLVLEEVSDDQSSSLGRFRRIGCGRLWNPLGFDFHDAQDVQLELV